MHSASRDALARARDRLERLVDPTSDPAELDRLGGELFAVAGLLDRELPLRRALVDSSAPEGSRTELADRLLGDKVDEATGRTVRELVADRWSNSTELVEAVEELATQATLAVAEKDDSLSDVEDELFRFGRILEREPRLRTLLADDTTPPDMRVELLESVLEDKVRSTTARLLEQAVRAPHHRSIDRQAEFLAELAAQRRSRSIARVVAATTLTDEQERRLADSLSTLYGRQVSVQVDVDPELIGGAVVTLGDEVIDGSVASRLRAASEALPH